MLWSGAMTARRIAFWLLATLLMLAVGVLAGVALTRAMDLPPAKARSLSDILSAVERKGLGAVAGVEYEREWWQLTGRWEVRVCAQECLELTIDPQTGQEMTRKPADAENGVPPQNAASPTQITRVFEQRGLGVILEMEFAHGAWQVEFREARGLLGALQPTRRRVYEPLRTLSNHPVPPRASPPARRAPRERTPQLLPKNLIKAEHT